MNGWKVNGSLCHNVFLTNTVVCGKFPNTIYNQMKLLWSESILPRKNSIVQGWYFVLEERVEKGWCFDGVLTTGVFACRVDYPLGYVAKLRPLCHTTGCRLNITII